MMLAVATALVWTGCNKEDSKEDSPQQEAYVITLKDLTSNSEWVFNHNTWFDQTSITIYDGGTERTVNLPWAPVSNTSMPAEYLHPESEFLKDGTTRLWQLAFNFCEDPNLSGTNMFGLWNPYAQTMRIYRYLTEMPNPLARSCFYQIESTAPCLLDPDTKMFMPADYIYQHTNWAGTIGNGLPVPSKNSMKLLPITGTLDGQVNKGWLCFELHFGSGLSELKNNDSISFTLYGVQDISFTGKMDIKGAMNSTDGTITIPGNDARTASAGLKAAGSFLSDLSECVKTGVEVGKEAGGTFGVITGLVGGVGAICSLVGESLGIEKDKEESGSKQYSLKLGFNMSSTGELNGSLKSTLATNTIPVRSDFGVLFSELPGGSSGITKAESGAGITLGVWNLKNQPVIYMADDFVFGASEDCKDTYYASFLDPTSLELLLNRDKRLFPSNEVETVTMLAYDYVFANSKYDVPPEPYKDFYGIPRETFTRQKQESIKVEADLHTFMLSSGADYNDVNLTRGTYKYDYLGTTSQLDGLGLDAYNLVYSPILGYRGSGDYIDYLWHMGGRFWYDPNINFDDVYVAVCIQVDFKNGYSQVFAERFLPVIKRFSSSDVPSLKERLSKAAAPENTDGIPVVFPFFDMQRDKAVRMLDAAGNKYPAVYIPSQDIHISGTPNPYGLRIRDWSKDAPGLVIQTRRREIMGSTDIYFTYPSKMVLLHDYLTLLDDWDNIDKRLKDMKMPTLDNYFRPTTGALYNMRTGESRKGTRDEYDNAPSVDIFFEDKDGNTERVGFWDNF